jgi:hypothetical protein|tara:strand:- start:95 stop:1276 length:1182 start_codon:yes stop_codon:yes gene_type:complete
VPNLQATISNQLSTTAAQTTLSIQELVSTMRSQGMADQAIRQTLLNDLNSGGQLFGSFRNKLKNTVKNGVELNAKDAVNTEYKDAGVQNFQWISVGDNKVCIDCEERHRETGTLEFFETIGLPASGFSVCQTNCRCQIVPQDYKGENLDKPLIKNKKIQNVTIPSMAGKHKTTKDSLAWMKANGVVSAKFSKLPLDYANEITKAIAIMPKRIKKDLVVGDFSQFQKAQGSKFRAASGHNFGVSNIIPKDLTKAPELKLSWEELKKGNYSDYKIVGFNTRQYKSLKEVSKRKIATNERWLKEKGRPFHFNTTGEAMIHHEFGHLIENRILSIEQRKKWNQLAEKWLKVEKTEYIKKRTAWTEFYGEAFAEAWGAYQTGQKSRLPDYILDFIDNI